MFVFYRSPVCAVIPNHEVVVFQPRTVTAPDLGYVANITTILSLPLYLFHPCSGSLFTPPSGSISYYSPIFIRLHHFSLSFYLLPSPPHLAWARNDRPPGRLPHPPASTSRLRFPHMTGGPRSSLHSPVISFPRLVYPPLPSLTCSHFPVIPRGYPI